MEQGGLVEKCWVRKKATWIRHEYEWIRHMTEWIHHIKIWIQAKIYGGFITFVPDSFIFMAYSFRSHGGLGENDDLAKWRNESAMWKNESTIKIDESCWKKGGNQAMEWRIHYQHWRIHFGTGRILQKLMNTPCLQMNKAGKGHFWRCLKEVTYCFSWKKWRIHE